MEDRVDLERRIATLESENASAKPLHEEFRADIADLKEGQTEIKTTLKLLVTNGRKNGHKGNFLAAGSGVGAMGLLGALLRWLGAV